MDSAEILRNGRVLPPSEDLEAKTLDIFSTSKRQFSIKWVRSLAPSSQAEGDLSLSVGKALQPLIKLLISFALAYLAILLAVWLLGDHMIFFPNYPGRMSGDWQPEGLAVQDVWLQTADGVKLHSWWIPAEGAQFTLLVFHGNAANIANRADLYHYLHDLPANVLAVEYRGYGRSGGQPSEDGLYEDAEAAWEYVVRQRGISPNRVIAFGASLGTAVAVDLAAKRAVAGVVLVAPFASSKAVARRLYPFLPGAGSVVRSKFNSVAKLPQVHAPFFIAHCTRDPVLPFALGEEVYRLAHEPKVFLRVDGSCHEEALLIAPADYRAQLLAFLSQIAADT